MYCFYQFTYHAPLALGMVISSAKQYENGILLDTFEFIPYFFFDQKSLAKAIRKNGDGIVLFSDYVWNQSTHLRVSKKIKEQFPSTLLIHGGPSVPNYHKDSIKFLENHTFLDILVHGEGEKTLVEVLLAIREKGIKELKNHLSDIAGISFCLNSQIVRTQDRQRTNDLSSFPSPYITGEFNTSQKISWQVATVETNRGCPYSCTFCDWGINQKIRMFPLEKVQAEFEWLGKNKMGVVFIADSNFGIFARDVEIAKELADTKKKYGYPSQVFVNFAKHSTLRLAEIIKIFTEAGLSSEGIISIQTRDPVTLDNIRRSNIKSDKYDELIDVFRNLKLPISTDLMLGLPGATLESFSEDLQYFYDKQTHVKLYASQLLPNTPMSDPEYMDKYKIVIDKDGYLISTYSYAPEDRSRMIHLYKTYHAAVMFGVLKYFLRYLQNDHGIKALNFLNKLSNDIYQPGYSKYPYLKMVFDVFNNNYHFEHQSVVYSLDILTINWPLFYLELVAFLKVEFGLAESEELRAVFKLQSDLMPGLFKKSTKKYKYKYNFKKYFSQVNTLKVEAQNFNKLEFYREPYSLEVVDRDKIGSFLTLGKSPYNIHRIHFELYSELRADQSDAFFVFFEKDLSILDKIKRRIQPFFQRLSAFVRSDWYSPLGNINRD